MADAWTTSLTLRNVAISRGDQRLVAGLDLSVGPGDAVWITGANGVGKTSLLLACAGLISADDGSIDWSTPSAVRFAPHVGPERDGLTLGEELSFWQAADRDRLSLDERLQSVGLAGRAATPVAGLSAGQRRRLSLARLLAADRPAWLMDEPLSGLDAEGRDLVTRVLSDHLRRGGLALIASHQPVPLIGANARRLVLEAQA